MAKFDFNRYSFRKIDSYNKAINFVISPRELGKTTTMWYQKIYGNWKRDKKPWLYLVRFANEITDELIDGILTPINKFSDTPVEFTYGRSSLKNGIIDVFINKQHFIRILAINIRLRRIKLSIVKNIAGCYMDEYIIDPNTGEKYLADEAMKIKEIYTTYRRECDGTFKMYFTANPYSLFNPIFMWLGVDTNKLRPGAIIVGDIYVVQCATLPNYLKEQILKNNPLFNFDDSYKKYGFEGLAINDTNIRIGSCPPSYKLNFVIRIENKILAIYQNNYWDDGEDRYYVDFIDEVGSKRTIYVFDFSQMVNRSQLMGYEDKSKLNRFKIAMRKRLVVFNNINCYYLTEEVYKQL